MVIYSKILAYSADKQRDAHESRKELIHDEINGRQGGLPARFPALPGGKISPHWIFVDGWPVLIPLPEAPFRMIAGRVRRSVQTT